MLRKLAITLSAVVALTAVAAPAATAAPSHGVSPSACIGRYPICQPGGGY